RRRPDDGDDAPGPPRTARGVLSPTGSGRPGLADDRPTTEAAPVGDAGVGQVNEGEAEGAVIAPGRGASIVGPAPTCGRLEGLLKNPRLGGPSVDGRRMRQRRCGSASGRSPIRSRFLPEALEGRCLLANMAGPSIPGSLVPSAINSEPVGNAR